MNEIKDGGPAFPREHASDGHNGMTLRDFFAAKAVAGFVRVEAPHSKPGMLRCADLAYMMADAMLKAREVKA